MTCCLIHHIDERLVRLVRLVLVATRDRPPRLDRRRYGLRRLLAARLLPLVGRGEVVRRRGLLDALVVADANYAREPDAAAADAGDEALGGRVDGAERNVGAADLPDLAGPPPDVRTETAAVDVGELGGRAAVLAVLRVALVEGEVERVGQAGDDLADGLVRVGLRVVDGEQDRRPPRGLRESAAIVQ